MTPGGAGLGEEDAGRDEARRVMPKRYAYAVRRRTLAIIRRVDAQTDAVDALGKRREDAENAMKREKARKRPT